LPGAFSEIKGERLKILYAVPGSRFGGGTEVPGQVIDDQLTVACGSGLLKLLKVQRPGSKVMERSEFLRGCPIKAGEQFN